MRKKINLSIKDYREFFNEPQKKEPYFLMIDFGENYFYFSNRKKAVQFLTKFQNTISKLLHELVSHSENLLSLNLKITPSIKIPPCGVHASE